ncbi:hypothetical protein WKI65_37175 [Streptomyces sp. MS1.AVA.3]
MTEIIVVGRGLGDHCTGTGARSLVKKLPEGGQADSVSASASASGTGKPHSGFEDIMAVMAGQPR